MNSENAGLDYRLLFEEAAGLFLVLAPDSPTFTILGASDAYLKATLTDRESITGKGVFEVFPDGPAEEEPSLESSLRASLERVLTNKVLDVMPIHKYALRRPLDQGGGFEPRFWSPRNSPVLGARGEVKYLLNRVEDVTEFIRANHKGEEFDRRTQVSEFEVMQRSRELEAANAQLHVANEKLAELDKAKTAFFSNISHEFRTPLTLLLGPIENCLADLAPELPVRFKERFKLIHQNALRLLRHVNALLDFSRIEAGKMQATYVPTDIAKFTAQLSGYFQSAMADAGLRFGVECPSLSGLAYVDRGMWEKIVLNLVSNAFKHTFDGQIIVRVVESADRYLLIVEDTGTGIPPDELVHIFERFHRVEGAKARTLDGTGIGLSLVQELVKLHGGEVQVRSVVGEGSAFTVSLPKGQGHLPTQHIGPSDAEPAERGWTGEESTRTPLSRSELSAWVPSNGGWRTSDEIVAAQEDGEGAPNPGAPLVLIVEDNADLRGYISSLLTPFYSVKAVNDGRQALSAVQERAPDLVLSDVMMPGLDGFGLLRALRADPVTRSVPFILLSARAGEESTLDGLDAGADDCLAKPFSTRELLARVRTHLELARTRQAWAKELELANEELESFSYSVSHDLRAPLRAIDGFSKALLNDYESKLDEQGRHYLHRVRSGTQRMSRLIDDLLDLSRINRSVLGEEAVDLSRMAEGVVEELRRLDPERQVSVEIAEGLATRGDRRLIAIALENLLGNAWKFTGKRQDANIQFGCEQTLEGRTFFVRDNGAGFDMSYADKLFAPFQRMHKSSEFEGTGVGLATVKRVIARHGGRVWANAAPDEGATIFFTFGDDVT